MKIIHCADLHLDSNMESNLSREQAMLRREELLETYEAMVAYGAANQVSHPYRGGPFLTNRISARRQNRECWSRCICIRRWISATCGEIMISAISCRICRTMSSRKSSSVSEDQWTSYVYGDVVISGLELNRQNSRTLGMDLVLDQTKCNIVMLHGQEADYESKDPAEVVQLSALRRKVYRLSGPGPYSLLQKKRAPG